MLCHVLLASGSGPTQGPTNLLPVLQDNLLDGASDAIAAAIFEHIPNDMISLMRCLSTLLQVATVESLSKSHTALGRFYGMFPDSSLASLAEELDHLRKARGIYFIELLNEARLIAEDLCDEDLRAEISDVVGHESMMAQWRQFLSDVPLDLLKLIGQHAADKVLWRIVEGR